MTRNLKQIANKVERIAYEVGAGLHTNKEFRDMLLEMAKEIRETSVELGAVAYKNNQREKEILGFTDAEIMLGVYALDRQEEQE